MDGTDQGVITPDQSKKMEVPFGEHVLKCTIEAVPDLVWRKVIEVNNSNQVAALVTLKALHVQYDAALVQRNKAALAQQQHQGDTAASERKASNDTKGPTVAVTMKFIQDTLSSIGSLTSTTTSPNAFTGGTVSVLDWDAVSDVEASPQYCSMSFVRTWGWSTTERGVSSVRVFFRDVVNVILTSKSKQLESLAGFHVSPDYPIMLIKLAQPISVHTQFYKKTKITKERNDDWKEVSITFADQDTAIRTGKAIRYAASLCGASPAAF
jgi:hypothetical protein